MLTSVGNRVNSVGNSVNESVGSSVGNSRDVVVGVEAVHFLGELNKQVR